MDRAVAHRGELWIMGDYDYRLARTVAELEEELVQVGLGGAVEVAGRFVGKEDCRAVDQGSGDGHALLLAA